MGVGVLTDLSPAQRDELNSLKWEGNKGYYKNGKLMIDHSYRPSNTAESEPGNPASDSQSYREFRFVPTADEPFVFVCFNNF